MPIPMTNALDHYARILLVILPRTRDALVVGPQPLLIFQRHRAAIAFAQIAHACRSLTAPCCSVPRRRPRLRSASSSSRLAASPDWIVSLGRFACAACQRSTNRRKSSSVQPKFFKQLVVDLLAVQLIGQLVEHQIGLLAGVFQDWPRRLPALSPRDAAALPRCRFAAAARAAAAGCVVSARCLSQSCLPGSAASCCLPSAFSSCLPAACPPCFRPPCLLAPRLLVSCSRCSSRCSAVSRRRFVVLRVRPCRRASRPASRRRHRAAYFLALASSPSD